MTDQTTLKHGDRNAMPPRRFAETSVFKWDDGIRDYDFTLGLGWRDDKSIGEFFLNIGKDGAILGTMSRDAAILASLLLQYGCPLDVIRGAVLRNPNGTAAGPIGAVLDRIDRLERERGGGHDPAEKPARDFAGDLRAKVAAAVRPLVDAVLAEAGA